MVTEVRSFAVTVPAATPQTSPQVSALTMPARLVRTVRVRIPPGPAGTVGWALGAAGVKVIPWGTGQWIVGDDETLDWSLDEQITSGAWQLQAYNTGVYAHTLYVTFGLDLVQRVAVPLAAAPLDLSGLSSAPIDSMSLEGS